MSGKRNSDVEKISNALRLVSTAQLGLNIEIDWITTRLTYS
ncbi:hypothetical protein SAMN06269173_103492 [Hymenobacter mucosus]|uniref:Uncharacterized protein n=1 Tax=Hymenobacter mucosus TaxID=1411120 RepID=A0A238X5Y1_9BACT|nr:hypothetical protein SAMN06269173_103492 [Hymenobacter mucosus]